MIWKVRTVHREMYLTFDDGPHPEVTRYVMDELDKRGFRATFFCIGENVEKHTSTYREILERGHKTGNHTYHHVNGWKTSGEKYVNEVTDCSRLVDSQYFRPPYGKISRVQRKALKGKYKIVMWTLLSWDFKRNFNPVRSLFKLKKYTRHGSIVVFHDNPKFFQNLRSVLPDYLDFLQAEGYKTAVFE